MSFDRLAPHYDWMEALSAGGKLQRARTQWLEELRGCRRVLSVGEGHGRFADAFVARFPEISLTCVDASPRMLAKAQQRLGRRTAHVDWQCAELHSWKPVGKFDAIVTCFFLDCFTPVQLAAAIAKLTACSEFGAKWIVADFAVPTHGLARQRARFIHGLMYAFFRLSTRLPARRLTPPDDLLRAQGFRRRGRREFDWGLLHADWWIRE